jgi:hypothetical protein
MEEVVMTRAIPESPDLDQYRTQAKELLRAHAAGDESVVERIRGHHPRLGRAPPDEIRQEPLKLADAQLVLARELGLSSWARLKQQVERIAAGEIPAATQGFYWYADRAGRIAQ